MPFIQQNARMPSASATNGTGFSYSASSSTRGSVGVDAPGSPPRNAAKPKPRGSARKSMQFSPKTATTPQTATAPVAASASTTVARANEPQLNLANDTHHAKPKNVPPPKGMEWNASKGDWVPVQKQQDPPPSLPGANKDNNKKQNGPHPTATTTSGKKAPYGKDTTHPNNTSGKQRAGVETSPGEESFFSAAEGPGDAATATGSPDSRASAADPPGVSLATNSYDSGIGQPKKHLARKSLVLDSSKNKKNPSTTMIATECSSSGSSACSSSEHNDTNKSSSNTKNKGISNTTNNNIKSTTTKTSNNNDDEAAYRIFEKERHQELIEDYPNLSKIEAKAMCSRSWERLNASAKAPYIQRAAAGETVPQGDNEAHHSPRTRSHDNAQQEQTAHSPRTRSRDNSNNKEPAAVTTTTPKKKQAKGKNQQNKDEDMVKEDESEDEESEEGPPAFYGSTLRQKDCLPPGHRELDVGTLVYGEWSGNKAWYWGNIAKKFRRKRSHFYLYDIKFLDGDYEEGASSTKILTLEEYIALDLPAKDIPTSAKKIAKIASPSKSAHVPKKQATGDACGECISCTREACGDCSRCKSKNGLCFQKVCSNVAQTSEYLPDGFTFCWDDDRNQDLNGLQIKSAGGRIYNRVESIQWKASATPDSMRKACLFYNQVGLPQAAAALSHSQQSVVATETQPQARDNNASVVTKKIGEANPYSPSKLWKNRCGSCENCLKADCLSCKTCKNSKGAASASRECCLQKMCCQIVPEKRVQAAPFFPPGWFFEFLPKPVESVEEYKGLILWAPSGRRYRSVETAQSHNPKALAALDTKSFLSHVGLMEGYSGAIETKYSPVELWDKRCGKCHFCTRSECLKCASCLDNAHKGGVRSRECCLQMMCSTIPLEQRAQPAVGFPPGWFFVFGESNKMLLFGPNGCKYNSPEAAVGHNHKTLSHVNTNQLLVHVGLLVDASSYPVPAVHIPQAAAAGRTQKRPRDADYGQGIMPPAAKKPCAVAALTLRELYEGRCGSCMLCLQPNCEKCSACKNNDRLTRSYREVCVRKTCCKFTDLQKMQPAKGFPDGWRFMYCDPAALSASWYKGKTDAISSLPGLVGLVIESPAGMRFATVERASNYYKKQLEDVATIARTFYKDVGAQVIEPVEHHELVGRHFCQKWISVDGSVKSVSGKVLRCEKDLLSGGANTFTVKYNEDSRAMANSVPNRCGLRVPPELPIREDFIHQTWLLPDVPSKIDYEFVRGRQHRLPRLTFVIRGFKLCFSVRTSSIPNAGFGVFVSCTNLSDSADPYFELPAGELLDLGVYGPLRADDLKRDHILSVKNFIHSLKCEEWIFETHDRESLDGFDITDDVTGDLHDLAKRQVTVFANETDGNEIPTITALHDPEGALHYLFGHRDVDDGPCRVPVDSEFEVKIDYGEQYESVRVKKGYSRLPPAEVAAKKLELADEDLEYVDEFRQFTASEIYESLQFLRKLFSQEREFSTSVIERAMLLAVLFKKRIREILKEFGAFDSSHVCDNGALTLDMQWVLKEAGGVFDMLFKFWGSATELKKSLLGSGEAFKTALKELLQVTPQQLNAMEAGEFYEHLLDL